MTDHIAGRARLEAELDLAHQHRDTVPVSSLPPHDDDTGPISQADRIKAAAAIAILDAMELSHELDGALALAQHKTDAALGMTADEEAKRNPTRLERLETQFATVIDSMQRLEKRFAAFEAQQDMIILEVRRHGCHITPTLVPAPASEAGE